MSGIMTVDSWAHITPETRVPIFKSTTIMDLAKEVLEYHFVILEGCRSSGKTYTANRLGEILDRECYATWKYFGGLKQFISGQYAAADMSQIGLDISMANIFALECLTQLKVSNFIFDRGYYTTMQFQDKVHQTLWDCYHQLVIANRGCVVFVVSEDEPDYLERLKSRQIEVSNIEREYWRYMSIVSRIPNDVPVLFRKIKKEVS